MESGIKYLKGNFWPTVRFVDVEDLNRQARVWLDTVANVRRHGSTGERPVDRLRVEREVLRPLPGLERLRPWLREQRRVVGMATCSGRGRGTGCLGPGSLGRWCRCRRKTGW